MSIGKDPLFRDQYAGGSDYSADVQAALNGTYDEPLSPEAQAIANRRKGATQTEQNLFARPAVKLR